MNINRKETKHVLTLATPVAVGSGTGDYDDLINKPRINDVELQGNVSLEDLGIQEFIDSITTVYRYKGNVATVADLSSIQNPDHGDVYHVEENGNDYCWNEDENRWDNLGNFIQIESLTNEEIDAIISSLEDGG